MKNRVGSCILLQEAGEFLFESSETDVGVMYFGRDHLSCAVLIYDKYLLKVFQVTNLKPGRGPSALADCQAKLLYIHSQVAACLKICQIFCLIIYDVCTITAVSYFTFSEETHSRASSASDRKIWG